MIIEGRAHEISEGDTFYLGACTKGSTAEKSLREQPFNEVKAKQRAYSLKQGYVNHIIASISATESKTFGKIIKRSIDLESDISLEAFVLSKFIPFYGKKPLEIENIIGKSLGNSAKSYLANLTNAILGVELGKKIEEFEKAEITTKTVRLQQNGLPKESISFPNFEFEKLVETDWEESDFKKNLNRKFFFVFYRIEEGIALLEKVQFWNMPHKDILEAKKVWNKTRSLLRRGKIVKQILGDRRFSHFPNKSENKVSHVRPHARNRKDTLPLPVRDQLTNLKNYTKHCFWLNANYVRDEIYQKYKT